MGYRVALSFDSVSHDWLMRFLGHRIGDTRMLRMIKRFLKAGTVEDGTYRSSEEGTPQGGVISPLLANAYLHYALDLWIEQRVKRHCRGYMRMIRYADDFVVCFEHREEAERFRWALTTRLERFGLQVEPSKTKVLVFGRKAAAQARREGRKLETFDFLGFTHYASTTRSGRGFRMKRVTARKKFRAKVQSFKEWIRANRTTPIQDIWPLVRGKLVGHFRYYGVTDNGGGVRRYRYEIVRLLFKWLNRRGGRCKMSWAAFTAMLSRHPLPTPRIYVNLIPFYAK